MGAIVYFIAALFLPYIVAILLGVLVFLLVAFGGGRFYNRGI
jgi:hypothetical protein